MFQALTEKNGSPFPDVGFVACIEGGVLEAQALLLFESIRRYTGRFRDAALYALSPRVGHPISRRGRERLEALGVHYSDEVLNTECPNYGSANRVAAAAHVEETSGHEILVVLDSDTLFLGEPTAFLLGGAEVAVRPVDIKGICTSGRADASDAYWRDLCRCCGVDYERIPWGQAFVDHSRIKASYNGGLVVVRRQAGILRRWAQFFFSSLRHGVLPPSASTPFRAGAGWVDPGAARLWGSNQAALSLAIWSADRRVLALPPTYNYPLHFHDRLERAIARTVFPSLVHVHYHWLLAGDALATNPLFDGGGPLSASQRDWLGAATPIG